MLIVFIRTLILYTIVIVVMRIMGKRQIGQLQPFELAVAIMISELAAIPMQDKGIPLLNGIIPILTLLVAQVIISVVALKSNKMRGIICGKPCILVENGKLVEENLKKEMFTLNDLLEQLRIKNVPNVSDVEFAIMETNGQVSIIPKSQKRPIIPEDIKVATNYEGIPLELIIDGEIQYENLKKARLDENWLIGELTKLNINSYQDVFFASLDSSGKLYYQKRKIM